jgi:hypothetical protein
MGRVVFGLALMSLMLCSSAFAGDVPNSDSGGSRQLQKPSPPSQMHRPKSLRAGLKKKLSDFSQL